MELEQLAPNLWVPREFEKHHHYFADGKGEKEYTGVTSVCGVIAKPALIGWAARMACDYMREQLLSVAWQAEKETGQKQEQVGHFIEDIEQWLEEAKDAHRKKKEAAGTHGTDAHALVEDWINLRLNLIGGEPKKANLVGFSSINPFIEWAKENVDHFLFAERRMADPELFIAGTADFAYVGKDGKRYMGDFKTSSGIYGIDYFLQVAAYRMLAEKNGDAPYDGMMIVRLGKDGKFETQYLYDYITYRDAFVAALRIYRAQAALKGVLVKGE